MAMTASVTAQNGAPEALHLGAADLPFVEIGDGNKLKVIHVDEKEGLWIVENIFQAGYAVQKHRHTGPVWGYTTSGRLEVRGVRLREPGRVVPLRAGGSIHTLTCIEDDTQVWFHMYGVNLNLGRRRQHRVGGRRRRRAGGLLRALRGPGLRSPERHRGVTVPKRRIARMLRRACGEEVRPWWTRPETGAAVTDAWSTAPGL